MDIALVMGLVVSAVILFATERLPMDLTAMIIMGAMLLSGIITSGDAIGGFSNPATVTVGAMVILSAGLFKTGAVNLIGGLLGVGSGSANSKGVPFPVRLCSYQLQLRLFITGR